MYIYMCVCVYMCMNVYICIYVYTYTHTHIYIYIWVICVYTDLFAPLQVVLTLPPGTEGVIVLNISSYGGGSDLWGHEPYDDSPDALPRNHHHHRPDSPPQDPSFRPSGDPLLAASARYAASHTGRHSASGSGSGSAVGANGVHQSCGGRHGHSSGSAGGTNGVHQSSDAAVSGAARAAPRVSSPGCGFSRSSSGADGWHDACGGANGAAAPQAFSRSWSNGSGEWGGESPWVAPSMDDGLLEV